MWRERIKSVSVAEIKLLILLSHRLLTRHLYTQLGFTFNPDVDNVAGTTVDFFWRMPYLYAVFLDGEPHLKSHQLDTDELVDNALKKRGIIVDRFQYSSPISETRLKEIGDSIETRLLQIKEAQKPKSTMQVFILAPERLFWFLKKKMILKCATCEKWLMPADIVVSKARYQGHRKLRCLDCAIKIGLLTANIITI